MITAISVLGVAAGVMALVIALAVTNGFRNTLQRNLLGAMAHINVVPRTPGDGIENWQELVARIRKVPHVTAVSPALYSPTFLSGPLQSRARSQGRRRGFGTGVSGTLRHLKAGSRGPPARSRRESSRASSWARGWRKIPGCAWMTISILLTDEMLPRGHAAREAALQGVRHVRNRLLRDRRQLGVHVASARRRRRSPWTRSTRSNSTWTI